jgi:hypothetical protein
MLDILEDFMALRDIPYARLDGQTTRPRRTFDIKLVSCFDGDAIIHRLTDIHHTSSSNRIIHVRLSTSYLKYRTKHW